MKGRRPVSEPGGHLSGSGPFPRLRPEARCCERGVGCPSCQGLPGWRTLRATPMSPTLRKLLLATLSTAVGLAVAYGILQSRSEPETVALVDNSEELSRLLEERQGGAVEQPGGPEGSEPPAEPTTAAGEAGPAAPSAEEEALLAVLSPDAPLVREPLDEAVAAKLYPSLQDGKGGRIFYDPDSYFWEQSGLRRRLKFEEHPDRVWFIPTNDLGFRKAVPVLEQQPDLRILVSGDSHTAGVVPTEEAFMHLLEARLASERSGEVVEALNAGKGGYAFYNYLGVLEKFLDLDPDVYVVAAFGGNDFIGSVGTFRYFNRLRPARQRRPFREKLWRKELDQNVALVAQGLNQVVAFAKRPDDIEVAEAAACQVLGRIIEVCEAEGIRFVFVYIPPLLDAQPHLIQETLDTMTERFLLSPEELGVADRIADGVLAFLESRSAVAVDMRPAYRASEVPCYWMRDHHINTEGHRLIADALEPLLAR